MEDLGKIKMEFLPAVHIRVVLLWIIFYSYTYLINQLSNFEIDTLSPNSDHCPLTFILDVHGIRRSQRISNFKDNPITRYRIFAENKNNFEASLWTSEWLVNVDCLTLNAQIRTTLWNLAARISPFS